MNDQRTEVIFTVQLDKPVQISKVVFGSLFNPAYRILPAGSAKVEVSDDGKQYREVATASFTRQLPEKGRKAYTDSLSFSPTEAGYVKVTIRNGGTLRNGIDFKTDSPKKLLQAEIY